MSTPPPDPATPDVPVPPDGPPAAGEPSPAAAPPGPPVCPRHPDRVSYVRCQRCERPVCPECQRPAAVGVHCVDCVREAARTSPTARTAFGAPLRRGAPLAVTYTLIGLNVVSFLLQSALGPFATNPWIEALIFAPSIGEAEPWRFLTSAFLHYPGSLFHIGFNMYALWSVGQFLEPALGRARFLSLYLVSAVGGHVMVLLLAGDEAWRQGVVGASGAVFGLFGAVFIIMRRLGRDPRGIVVLLVINAVIGFVIPRISWEGHLGGFLVGAALGFAFAYAPKERRRAVAIWAPVAMLVILIGLAALTYANV